MNKGVILKVTKEYAIVLSEQNAYYRLVVKEGMQVGKKIYFFEEDVLPSAESTKEVGSVLSQKRKKIISYSALAASMLLFFLFSGISGLLTGEKDYYALVSIDINPSIELKISEDNQVIAVESLNPEGQRITGEDLIGMQVQQAIESIIHNAEKQNYLTTDQDSILLAAALNPSSQELSELETEQALVKVINGISVSDLPDEYNYLFVQVDQDALIQAKEYNLSIGKYEMVILSEGVLQAEKVKNMKVKEILDENAVTKKIENFNPNNEKKEPIIVKWKPGKNNVEKDKANKESGSRENSSEKREESKRLEPARGNGIKIVPANANGVEEKKENDKDQIKDQSRDNSKDQNKVQSQKNNDIKVNKKEVSEKISPDTSLVNKRANLLWVGIKQSWSNFKTKHYSNNSRP